MNPDINPYVDGQLILYKSSKTIQCGQNRFFQQMVLGEQDIYMQRNEVGILTQTLYKNKIN